MKIGNSPEGSASPPKADRADKAATGHRSEAAHNSAHAAKAAPTAPTPAASAQVAISQAAQAAQVAASSSTDDGSFDAAKVSRISKAISEGKFTVNANAIADKLVANAQELLDSRVNKH